MRSILILVALLCNGCSTRIQQLELKREQLLRIERSTEQTRQLADEGAFDPTQYDAYLLLNRSLFDTILAAFDKTQFEITASGRAIVITVNSLRLNLRAGSPAVTVVATAKDLRTGVVANVDLDATLLIERDTTANAPLRMRIIATRIVPQLRWGMFNLARWKFVQSLLALEATRFTENLPRIDLPVAASFRMGGPAGTQVITLPAGGAQITGVVRIPPTERRWTLIVEQILSLKNGVHVFANIITTP